MRTRPRHRPGVERDYVTYTVTLAVSTYAQARLKAARRGITTRQFLHRVLVNAILDPKE